MFLKRRVRKEKTKESFDLNVFLIGVEVGIILGAITAIFSFNYMM